MWENINFLHSAETIPICMHDWERAKKCAKFLIMHTHDLTSLLKILPAS